MVTLVMVVIMIGLNMNMVVDAQEKAQESCITAKCHVMLGKAKFVHGPVAVADCSPCHRLLPNEKHKFQPIKNTGQLCNACHEPMGEKAVVHSPVKTGECTACHDPHQSDQRYQIKKAPVADVCFTCHNRDLTKKKFAHGPAADGECIACHTPHTSENPKLLMQAGNNLCFECHTDMKDVFAQAKKLHKPAAEQCVQCHNPHSNDAQLMLTKDIPEQCFGCHKDIQEHVEKSLVKHKALDTDKKCLNCHSPHQAEYSKQLNDEPMALCLHCHDRAITIETAGTLMNMKEWFAKNSNWHGPIRERDCSGCHDVHGAANFRILKHYYPKEFYTSFSQDQYELCLSCHQPTLVQDPTTTTLTGFRDGDRNLHYLHVNKKVKGRTCRACHETHASQKPKHIREAVPFGQWMLPIRFEKTANGGRCTPGCHASKQYMQTLSTSGKAK